MKKKLVTLRSLSQIISLGLFVLFMWFASDPSYSFAAKIFYRLDPLVAFLVFISERSWILPLLLSLLTIAVTLLLGRVFCGWICPMGVMLDLAVYIRSKIKVLKKCGNWEYLKYIKYFILIVLTTLAVFKYQFFWWFDPITMAGRFVSMNFIPFFVNLNETFFRLLLGIFNYSEFILNIYRTVDNFLVGVRAEYFANAWMIFSLWLLVILTTLISSRFWCRNLCPLGAFLALFAKFSILERFVSKKCTNCRLCASTCRMGAIKDDNSYNKSECVLCMDCLYDCPVNVTVFKFSHSKKEVDVSRRDFLKFAALPFLAAVMGFGKKNILKDGNISSKLIRPPGALAEKNFVNRCIRCGNCLRVCVTNGLQPSLLETGLSGIWTPRLIPEIGHCEYNCTRCGEVCPTGAIPKLELKKKKQTSLGLARVDRKSCLPWNAEENCLVCEEHCPVSSKAIKVKEVKVGEKVYLCPVVDNSLCIGCGSCQNVCPVRPTRAINVDPGSAERT